MEASHRRSDAGSMVGVGDLLSKRYVSYVVRLLVDADGDLVSAEVIRVPLTKGRHIRRWGQIVETIRADVRQALDNDGGDTPT